MQNGSGPFPALIHEPARRDFAMSMDPDLYPRRTAKPSPLVVLAAIGLMLSLLVHLCAILGLPQPLGEATWALHIGAMLIWIPALLAIGLQKSIARRKIRYQAVFRKCPTWMRWMVTGIGIYAAINFFACIPAAAVGPAGNGATPAVVFRAFSGHWMIFYAAAFVFLYVAARSRRRLTTRG
jgi:hypothetical protein